MQISFGTEANQRSSSKRVLNAGCGANEPNRLHPFFRDQSWTEVRLDIDARVKPDIQGSIADLSKLNDASFDAIWCSHNLEHLLPHEVGSAIAGFRRVLKPDGFVVITSPDLEAIAELVVDGRLEDVAYQSPAGPITALDMIYGHARSIEHGNHFMAHHTGFTTERLGRLLVEGGFVEALVMKGTGFDLWALGLMPQSNKPELLRRFRANKLNFDPEAS
jgi:predicted SAM-dependent methyltransferase